MLSVSTQIAKEDDLTTFEKMLKSLSFADEILIFNMQRDDQAARELFSKYQARVINISTPPIVEHIRQTQLEQAKGDWVLVMDYDEVIPAPLAQEISKTITGHNPQFAGYFIHRRNFSLGYPLSHGGFGEDLVARLFYKQAFSNWPKEIHSLPTLKGEYGTLKNHMEHHKDASLAQMVAKTNRYSAIEAKQFYEGGLAPVGIFTLFRKPLMEFIRRYLLKSGFLDGKIGLLQAIYQSYSVFLSYAKLYELQNKKV